MAWGIEEDCGFRISDSGIELAQRGSRNQEFRKKAIKVEFLSTGCYCVKNIK